MTFNESSSALRDIKQVRNVKYNAQKQKRQESGHQQHRQNPADDMLQLISDLPSSPFIQEVVQTNARPPCIILDTQDSGKPFVVGVDRAFNLGPCYVTLLVIHNTNLLTRSSQEPPIFVGPMFLHWTDSFETYQYHRFFWHLRCKFQLQFQATET